MSSGPSMRSWPVRSLRRWQLCIVSVWTRSHPTSAIVLTTLVSNIHTHTHTGGIGEKLILLGILDSLLWLFKAFWDIESVGTCAVFEHRHTHTHTHTHTLCLTLTRSLSITGDQNAINDLMQMRLTGGGGGMMAEKLEVNIQELEKWEYIVPSIIFHTLMPNIMWRVGHVQALKFGPNYKYAEPICVLMKSWIVNKIECSQIKDILALLPEKIMYL